MSPYGIGGGSGLRLRRPSPYRSRDAGIAIAAPEEIAQAVGDRPDQQDAQNATDLVADAGVPQRSVQIAWDGVL